MVISILFFVSISFLNQAYGLDTATEELPIDEKARYSKLASLESIQGELSVPGIHFVVTEDEQGNVQQSIINNSAMLIGEAEATSCYKQGINFHYKEVPFKISVHNQRDWGKVYRPAPATVELPVGRYDVVAAWWDPVYTMVVIENIDVDTDIFTDILVDYGKAKNWMSILPVDQYGNYIQGVSKKEQFIIKHKVSPFAGGITYLGFKYPQRFKISDLSDNYIVSWGYKTLFHDDFFSIGGHSDSGISYGFVYQNDPADFKHLQLTFNVTLDDLTVNNPYISLAGSGPIKHFEPNTTYNFYLEPQIKIPELDWFLLFYFQENDPYGIYFTLGIGSHDGSHYGLYSSYYDFYNFPDEEPFYTIPDNRIAFGLGPDSFNLKFHIEKEIHLMRDYANPTIRKKVYITQSGEERADKQFDAFEEIPKWFQFAQYELYKDGFWIDAGLARQILGGPINQPIFTLNNPALYKLVFKANDIFYIRDMPAVNELELEFDTAKNDKDPPYFYSLQTLTPTGELTETIHGGGSLIFHVDDDVQIEEVSAHYSVDGVEMGELNLIKDGNKYSAQIPSDFLKEDAYVSLKIIAYDTAGNSLRYKFEPAFYFKKYTGPGRVRKQVPIQSGQWGGVGK